MFEASEGIEMGTAKVEEDVAVIHGSRSDVDSREETEDSVEA